MAHCIGNSVASEGMKKVCVFEDLDMHVGGKFFKHL